MPAGPTPVTEEPPGPTPPIIAELGPNQDRVLPTGQRMSPELELLTLLLELLNDELLREDWLLDVDTELELLTLLGDDWLLRLLEAELRLL